MVRFLESKDDKHRTWPRRVEESKDKEAKRAYRKKCEDFAAHDGVVVYIVPPYIVPPDNIA